MTRKSDDYYIGYGKEAARIEARDAARAALDGNPNVHNLAAEVAKQFARDHARKQQILQRSPHLAEGMDAEELASMSGRELAQRELSELGIKPDGRSVEEQLLDAHHSGRTWVRDGGILGGIRGMKGGAAAARRLIGGASDTADTPLTRYLAGTDAADPVAESALDKYLKE
jgi:hypothetical protein